MHMQELHLVPTLCVGTSKFDAPRPAYRVTNTAWHTAHVDHPLGEGKTRRALKFEEFFQIYKHSRLEQNVRSRRNSLPRLTLEP
jgi:hypothetical protein